MDDRERVENRRYLEQQTRLESAQGSGLDLIVSTFGRRRGASHHRETDFELRERVRPALVGSAAIVAWALLEAEHSSFEDEMGTVAHFCGVCGGGLIDSCPERIEKGERVHWKFVDGHKPGCVVDEALKAIGLPNQEARAAIRERVRQLRKAMGSVISSG